MFNICKFLCAAGAAPEIKRQTKSKSLRFSLNWLTGSSCLHVGVHVGGCGCLSMSALQSSTGFTTLTSLHENKGNEVALNYEFTQRVIYYLIFPIKKINSSVLNFLRNKNCNQNIVSYVHDWSKTAV